MDLLQQETNNNNSKGVSYTSGFFMLIGLALLGLAVSGFAGGMLVMAATGGKMKDLENIMRDPQYANILRGIQVASVIISMFIPAWFAASLLNRKPFQLLGFRREAGLSQIVLVIAIMFVSLFVASALATANKDLADAMNWKGLSEKLEKDYYEQVAIMLDLKSIGGYILSLVIIAFLPAVCEEALFRGGLQNFMTRATRKPWLSIIVVSILFSLVHFSVYLFLTRFFLGMVLGLIYHYTKNLWLCILGHFFNNALSVTSVYFFIQQGKSMQEAVTKDISAAYWGFLALPILIGLFMSLKKNSPQQNPTG